MTAHLSDRPAIPSPTLRSIPPAPVPAVPPAPAAPGGPAAVPAGAETATAAGLAAAQLVANGIAVIFTAVFARVLGREEYGVLAAALSSFLIFSVPGSALQVATARAAATRQLGARGELAATLRRWTVRLVAATVALSLTGVLLRAPLARTMGIDVYGAAAATLPTVSLWLLLCVQRGALAGMGAFRPVGASIVAEAAGRLVLGLVLVAAGLGTAGAYLGTPLAMAATAAVLAVLVARRTAAAAAAAPGDPAAARMREFAREAFAPVVALAFIAVLQNVDVIVIRHQVDDDAAGAYAAAAVAAKIVVWTAVGVGLYLIPGAAARAAQGHDARPVLLRALGVVAAVAAPALLIMIAAPELLLRIGFGEEYTGGSGALPLLGLAMTTLALTYLAVNFLLAIGATAFLVPLGLVAAAEPLLLALGAFGSLASFAAVVLALQLVAAAAVLVPSLRRAPAAAPVRA
jgi:O-antigen/teichoic acid export membrane protein